ncbi:MAG TPA: S-layer homology domain-containing protein [Symbiobacteriaceae bacterium]|nr:S-layer homology domain-containing protein [Symbiobacteriaceae bacterium]
MKRIWLLLLIALVSLLPAAPPIHVYRYTVSEGGASAPPDDPPPLVASYEGPNGVEIRSYSARWNTQEQLRSVYNELLANLHGPEMALLGVVNLWPEGGGGLYHAEQWSGVGGRSIGDDRIIDLFGADDEDLDSLARVLSHEYGHHFTIYYRWMREGADFTYWKEGRWADARGVRENPLISANSDEHGWLPGEIAAEDYAQLFGSPRSRQSTIFDEQSAWFSNAMHNLVPQENLTLPLAAEVPGYRDYWLTLSGLSVPLNGAPSRPWLQVLGGSGGYVDLAWTGAKDPEGGPLEFTVVSYTDPLGLPLGHLTVTGQTKARVRAWEKGVRNFRVFVKDDTGLVVSSPPVEVNLDQAVLPSAPPPATWAPGQPALPGRVLLARPAAGVPASTFSDVGREEWFTAPIDLVSAAGLMKGYPDGRFLPESPVRRAEFLAVVMRAYPAAAGTPLGAPFADVPASHWAYSLIRQARGAGLVQGDQNRFNPDGWITRAEMAVILHRALQLERPGSAPAFADVGPAFGWAREAIETLAGYGVILGFPGAELRYGPAMLSYRHQVAAILSRLFR